MATATSFTERQLPVLSVYFEICLVLLQSMEKPGHWNSKSPGSSSAHTLQLEHSLENCRTLHVQTL